MANPNNNNNSNNNNSNNNQQNQQSLSFEQELINLLKKRMGISEEILSDQQDLANVLKDQLKYTKFINREKQLLKNISNRLNSIAESSYGVTREEMGTSKSINDLKSNQVKLEKQIFFLAHQRKKFQKDSLRGTAEERQINSDIAETLRQQIVEAQRLGDDIGNIVAESEKIKNNFGVKAFNGLSAASDKLSKLTGIKNFSEPFKVAAEAAREQAQYNLENYGTTKGLSRQQLADNKVLNEKLDKYKKLRTQGLNVSDALKQAGVNAKQVKVGKLPIDQIAPFKAGVKSLGPLISKAFGPLAIFTAAVKVAKFFVDAMFQADRQITDLSKQMNITRDGASAVRDRMFEIKDQAKVFAKIQKGNKIIQEDLVKGQTEFNNIYGTSIDLTSRQNQKLLTQFTSISKFLKLSKEEQEGLVSLYTTEGKSMDYIKNNILGNIRLRKIQTGILVDERKILKNILTSSNAIKLTIRGQGKELSQAAFEAARLNLNFSDLETISGSLLNFQSSIESEMEAELLTGRQLNLERARAAALAGDQETLAKELSRQIGTSADFSKMNVIQQQALAKALGMNRNQLADTLIAQESLNKLKDRFNVLGEATIDNLRTSGKIDEATFKNLKSGKAASIEYYNALKKAGMAQEEIIKLLGQEAAASLETQSAQEKFNDVLNEAKGIFSRLVTGGILQSLVDILAGITDSALLQGYKEQGEAQRIQEDLEKKAKTDPESVSERELRIAESASDQVTGPEAISAIGGSVAAGAATGAAIGSVVPGIGTAIGAGIGALIAGVTSTAAVGTIDEVKKYRARQAKEIAEKHGLEGYEKVNPGMAEDFIMRPGQGIQKFRKDDIVIGGTNLLDTGGNNNEVVVLLKELITAVKSGGDVYMDSAKVGEAISLASSRMG